MRWTMSAADRFWSKTAYVGDCIVWTGASGKYGYGHFYDKGKYINAYRWAYEQLYGPVRKGLVLDHLCRNPTCVNPGHLEAVTHKQNISRGLGYGIINGMKKSCPQGHPYTADNIQIDGKIRRCRTCRRKYWAKQSRIRRGKGKS